MYHEAQYCVLLAFASRRFVCVPHWPATSTALLRLHPHLTAARSPRSEMRVGKQRERERYERRVHFASEEDRGRQCGVSGGGGGGGGAALRPRPPPTGGPVSQRKNAPWTERCMLVWHCRMTTMRRCCVLCLVWLSCGRDQRCPLRCRACVYRTIPL